MFIPKGTLIWKSTFSAEFQTGHQYRQFLKLLPDYLACDVLIWAYVYNANNSEEDDDSNDEDEDDDEDEDEDEYVVCVDLDEGSYTNGAYADVELNAIGINDTSTSNEWGSKCQAKVLFSSRDILPGEEIRCSYETLDYGWANLGLLDRGDDSWA
jgi:hypothetical protein